MLIEPLREQCRIKLALQEGDLEKYFHAMPEQLRFKIEQKDFSGKENYNTLIQSSLMIPFLIIFLTQIFLSFLSHITKDNFSYFFIFIIIFLSFIYMVYAIVQSRYKGEYPLISFAFALLLFDMLSTYVLVIDGIKVNLELQSLVVLVVSTLAFTFMLIRALKGLCTRNSLESIEIPEKIIGWVFIVYIGIAFFLLIHENSNFSIFVFSLTLYFFHILIILLHNEFLLLFNDNHKEENYKQMTELLLGINDGAYSRDMPYN